MSVCLVNQDSRTRRRTSSLQGGASRTPLGEAQTFLLSPWTLLTPGVGANRRNSIRKLGRSRGRLDTGFLEPTPEGVAPHRPWESMGYGGPIIEGSVGAIASEWREKWSRWLPAPGRAATAGGGRRRALTTAANAVAREIFSQRRTVDRAIQPRKRRRGGPPGASRNSASPYRVTKCRSPVYATRAGPSTRVAEGRSGARPHVFNFDGSLGDGPAAADRFEFHHREEMRLRQARFIGTGAHSRALSRGVTTRCTRVVPRVSHRGE